MGVRVPEATGFAGEGRPWIALGLTFLLIGLGYAAPVPLVRTFPAGIWEGKIPAEVLNLYALTAFLGWGHFLYAWQGQSRATRRLRVSRQVLYWAMVLIALAMLVVVRRSIGVGVFSLIVWVYNIGHFVKAESYFAGHARRGRYLTPVVAFAWFTIVLFGTGPLRSEPLVFCVTTALALGALLCGDWKTLTLGQSRMPVLNLFLFGETLVWSAYAPYMTPGFRVGIYVFHIAAASFFHYVSSYVFAQRSGPRMLLRLPGILAVNAMVIVAGCASDRLPALRMLQYVLSPEWFTLWVALHLAASDLLPWWRKRCVVPARAEERRRTRDGSEAMPLGVRGQVKE